MGLLVTTILLIDRFCGGSFFVLLICFLNCVGQLFEGFCSIPKFWIHPCPTNTCYCHLRDCRKKHFQFFPSVPVEGVANGIAVLMCQIHRSHTMLVFAEQNILLGSSGGTLHRLSHILSQTNPLKWGGARNPQLPCAECYKILSPRVTGEFKHGHQNE